MTGIRPAPHPDILEITTYVPGKSHAPAGITPVKLSSNESPLGTSPLVRQQIEKFNGQFAEYPDGSATGLRNAIASAHGLNPENIMCGNGSDDLLSLLAQTYLTAGDEAIYTEHGFLVYPIAIRSAGATPVVAPETDFTADVDTILTRVTSKTKMVFLANPNNPTGTYLPFDEVRRLQAGLRGDIILVLDAAYAEYVRKNDYEAGIELVSNTENVVMTRTFSKIYGLAGLRLGWMYAPQYIISILNRVRGPFNVNALALDAGIAAIGDVEHLEKCVQHNEAALAWVTEALNELGLTVIPSVANFVLINFSTSPLSAEAADKALSEQGYILRDVKNYGFDNALRMSLGTEAQNRAVVRILSQLVDGHHD